MSLQSIQQRRQNAPSRTTHAPEGLRQAEEYVMSDEKKAATVHYRTRVRIQRHDETETKALEFLRRRGWTCER